MNQSITKDIGLGDHPPIVIVYGNKRLNSANACAFVIQALDKAKVDCVVLEGFTALPMMAQKQATLQATNLTGQNLIMFSIVIPIYNEVDNIPDLYTRLTKVMAEMGESYEIIFVDDGSRDKSLKLLKDFHKRDPHVQVIRLARNFGQQKAISAGLDYANGQAVIVMDGDLQDPPEMIPKFISKWREDYQVVYAIREKRKENFLKRSLYHSFYLILQSISRIEIPLDTGDFCLMDRCVVDMVTALPERNRFVRGLRSWVGFRQVGLPFERDARFAGKPKYSIRKLVSLALDGLISFSYLPLRLSTLLGFVVSVLSLLTAVYYVILKLTIGLQPPGFATLTVLLLFLGGVLLITVGVIGEYIGHILIEVKNRPTYVVHQVFEGQNLEES